MLCLVKTTTMHPEIQLIVIKPVTTLTAIERESRHLWAYEKCNLSSQIHGSSKTF